jgi:hypothetical protein
MLGNRPMSDWIAQYSHSHQHPLNRVLHTWGIPMIAISVWLGVASFFVSGKGSRRSSSRSGDSCWWGSGGGLTRSREKRNPRRQPSTDH